MQASDWLGSAPPRRILRREWKRNKPHLPKSTSLPILRLIPIDRPIFTCHRCGFVNTLIPLCLWCCWTSDAARNEFELSMPRPRRITAPPRVIWKQSTAPNLTPTSPSRSSHRMAISKHSTTQTQVSLNTMTSEKHRSSDDLIMKVLSGQYTPVPMEDHSAGCPCRTNLTCEANHKATGNCGTETVATTTVRNVARATSPIIFTAFVKPRLTRGADDKPRALKDLGLGAGATYKHGPHRLLRCSRSSPGVNRPSHAMHVIKTLSTKSLRSTHIVIDFNALHESYDLMKYEHDHHLPASPKYNARESATPCQKTLRRKKRFHVSSPPSDFPSAPPPVSTAPASPGSAAPITVVRRPQSNTYPDDLVHDSSEPDTKIYTQASVHAHTHTRHKSQAPPLTIYTIPTTITTTHNPVRLGHPSRPLYTAIRPNMSRPIEPFHPMSLPSEPALNSRMVVTQRPESLPAPASSRAPSPGIFSVLSSTSAPEVEFEDPPRRPSLSLSLSDQSRTHRSSFTFTPPLPSSKSSRNHPRQHHHTGFSLSGETELRMALARGRRADEGEGEVFRFREMGRERGRRGEKIGGLAELGLMKGVERLKRGLKGLVTRSVS